MSFMLGGFFLYHLQLATTNVTTNERYKQSALLHYYQDKLGFFNHWKEHYGNDDLRMTDEDIKQFFVDTSFSKK